MHGPMRTSTHMLTTENSAGDLSRLLCEGLCVHTRSRGVEMGVFSVISDYAWVSCVQFRSAGVRTAHMYRSPHSALTSLRALVRLWGECLWEG